MVGQGAVRTGAVWQGTVGHGLLRQDVVWRGAARWGGAWQGFRFAIVQVIICERSQAWPIPRKNTRSSRRV